MKLFFRITLLSMMLLMSGCHLLEQNAQVKPIKNDEQIVIIEEPPKIVSTDWALILSPLINELLQTTEINENNQLLVSDVKNSSNGYVSSTRINNIILNTLNKQNIFNVMNKQTVNQAKSILGIPNDDGLVSRSKMIALARHIKADYVLFTTIKQVPQLPDIQADVSMELLLTKTGEIVWQFSSNQIVDTQLDNQSNN